MKYLLILLVVALVGCSHGHNEDLTTSFDVIKIGECQYLLRTRGYTGYLAHKGDCENPIHCHNRMED